MPVNSGLNPDPNSRRAATLPFTVTEPALGVIIPEIICSSVLLPLPFWPMIPNAVPRSTWNDTLSKARNALGDALFSLEIVLGAGTSKSLNRASRPNVLNDFETRSTRIATEVSEDISKAFSRALKPPEPEPGSDEAQRPIASPHGISFSILSDRLWNGMRVVILSAFGRFQESWSVSD